MNIMYTLLFLLLEVFHSISTSAYEIDEYHSIETIHKKNSITNPTNSVRQLSSDPISEIYDLETQTWLLTDEIIENIFSNDLQVLMDYTIENDILMFKTEKVIKLKNSINIKTKDLILTGYSEDVSIKDDIFYESETKAVFTCPDGKKAIFKLETNSIIFANFQIIDCDLDSDSEKVSPIMFDYTCSVNETKKSIKLQHMNFENNKNYFKSGCFSKASPNNENSDCLSLDLFNIEFENNQSNEGYIIGELLPYTNMNNITIKNNKYIKSGKASGILFYLAPEYELYANDLYVLENKGTILYTDVYSKLTMSYSRFVNNILDSSLGFGLFHIENANISLAHNEFSETNLSFLEVYGNSTVEIRESLFERAKDRAIYINGSVLNIEKCSFLNNSATNSGSAIYSIDADISIYSSHFFGNIASENAGAIYKTHQKIITFDFLIVNSTFDFNVALKGNGGCIYLDAIVDAIIIDSKFSNNSALENGGALYLQRRSLAIIENSEMMYNKAGNDGGALYLIINSNATIKNSDIMHNKVENDGGAITLQRGSLAIIENSEIMYNKAENDAGAIFLTISCNATIKNSEIMYNKAEDDGGAINLEDNSYVVIEKSEIMYNEAENDGGAFFLEINSKAEIENSLIESNIAENHGGALLLWDDSIVTIKNSLLENNIAENDGGALYLTDSSNTTIKNSTIMHNKSEYNGGALSLEEASNVAIENSEIMYNQADNDGGAIFIWDNSIVTIENSEIMYNQAENDGGALFLEDNSIITIENSEIMHNQAKYYGGALYAKSNSNISIQNTTFESNLANIQGSCIYFSFASKDEYITVNNSYFIRNNNSAFYLIPSDESLSEQLGNLFLYNSVFIENKNEGSSGGVISASKYIITIFNCSFTDNGALNGGVISANDYQLKVIQSSFINNYALNNGGSVYLSATTLPSSFYTYELSCESNSASKGGFLYIDHSSNITLENIFFKNNTANVDNDSHGGALYSESLLDYSYLKISNCTLISNLAKGKGGTIYLKGYHEVEVKMSEFNQCISESENYGGGAFAAVGKGWLSEEEFQKIAGESTPGLKKSIPESYGVDLPDNKMLPSMILKFEDVKFEGNVANFTAGVLHIEDGVMAGMSYCTFKNNRAQWAAAINNVNSEIYCDSCEFIENSSSETAAALRIEDTEVDNYMSRAVIKNSNFINNKAKSGTAIESIFEETAIYLLENNNFIENIAREEGGGAVFVNQNGFLYCIDSYFIDNTAESGVGGAIFIRSTKSEFLKYYFENCYFESNKAKYGGAMFIDEIDSTVANFIRQDYIYLYMKNNSFYSNMATTAGGIMMVDNPWMLAIECNSTHSLTPSEIGINGKYSITDFDSDNLKTINCENWINNTVKENGYDENMASNPTNLTVSFEPESDPFIYVSNGHYDDSTIFFQIYGMRGGKMLPNVTFITIDFFNNSFVQSVFHELSFELSYPDIKDLYFFDVDDYYNLTSGNVTVNDIKVTGPLGDYSILVKFNKNTFYDVLLKFELELCKIGEGFNFDNTTCELCGLNQYNLNVNAAECIPCPLNINCTGSFLMPEAYYWLSNPCSINPQPCILPGACIYGNRTEKLYDFISNINTCGIDENQTKEYYMLQCVEGYTGPLCGSCEPNYGRSNGYQCKECSSSYIPILYYIVSGLVSTFIIYLTIRANLTNNVEEQDQVAYRRSRGFKLYLTDSIHDTHVFVSVEEDKYKILMIETFKSFIGFVQLVATAMSINVDWGGYVETFFGIFDFIGNVAGNLLFSSLDCVIKDSHRMKKAHIRMIIDVLFPGLIFFFFVIFWTVQKIIKKKEKSYLLHRIVLSFLVIAYISYISTTEYLVTFIYCDNIYLYDEYDLNYETIKTHKSKSLWLEDTTVTCWDGTHLLVFIFFVMPLLTLFTFGFPFSIALMLIYTKHKKAQVTLFFKETLGFLSSAYKEHVNYWDTIIMVRKALLVIILVYTYQLGGMEQALFSILLLFFCFALHLYILPFDHQYEILNKCESASLLATIVTYNCALFFYTPKDGSNGESAIQIIVATILIGLNSVGVIFYLYSIIYYFRKWLHAFIMRTDTRDMIDDLFNSIHTINKKLYEYLHSIISFSKRSSSHEV